jgi:ribosomal protein S18 acetylase RimI-like enzyme
MKAELLSLHPVHSEQDFTDLSQIAQVITREHFTSILGKENADYCADNYCTSEAFAKEISDGNVAFFIDYLSNHIGYLQYLIMSDCLFVDKLYLLSEYRRKGIGVQIVDGLVTIAVSAGRSILRLEVNKRNLTAIEFYKHIGFLVVGEPDDNDGSVWDTCYMEEII